MLDLVVVGGPRQRILRPAELEAPWLAEQLEQSALYGDKRLFERTLGTASGLDGSDLVLRQERGAAIRVTEQGSVLLRVPLDEPRASGRSFDPMGGMIIIEEAVQQRLGTTLDYAAGVLDRVDRTQRLTHLVVAARLSGIEHRGWRTRAQHASNSSAVQMGHGGMRERPPITLAIRRAALGLDRTALIEDILVPLRRQFPIAS